MITVGLLRHGAVHGGPRFRGSTDDPLTETGYAQMCSATQTWGWGHVVTSPLARCAAFAEVLARQRGVPLIVDERLREIHFGSWEGHTAAQLLRTDGTALRRFWSDPVAHPPPGGESLADFGARVLEGWEQWLRHGKNAATLLITHGGVIRVLLCHLLSRPLSTLFDLDVPLGSLHAVRRQSRGYDIRRAEFEWPW